MRLRRGDTVVVLTGREKGKRGKIMRVDRSERRVVVQGVNIVKRHTRPSAAQPGGIVEKEAALHLSNVALADPKSGEPTRIGFRWLTDGRKVRYAKKSGEVIDA
ncbi:MAG: 50S ribosomal protein L24 [Alphaproteobacteria bacterium]|nr:50S ribosomal protein L24 [Alphaproteobacteria bacterium]